METFGFDHGLAHQAETALAAVLGGVILGGLLDSGGCGEDVEFAVGENAVYVEEKEFDFPGAKLGGLRFGHRGNSSITLAERNSIAFNSSRTRKPQNLDAAAQFLEVPVRGHKNCLTSLRQSGGKAIHIRYFVDCLDFTRLQNLRKIDCNKIKWKARQIRYRTPGPVFSVSLPQVVKDFSPIYDRHQ